VGVTMVLEDSKEPVQSYVDAGRLNHLFVVRFELDAAFFDLASNVTVAQQYGSKPTSRLNPFRGTPTTQSQSVDDLDSSNASPLDTRLPPPARVIAATTLSTVIGVLDCAVDLVIALPR
jgi:hypothetical protein